MENFIESMKKEYMELYNFLEYADTADRRERCKSSAIDAAKELKNLIKRYIVLDYDASFPEELSSAYSRTVDSLSVNISELKGNEDGFYYIMTGYLGILKEFSICVEHISEAIQTLEELKEALEKPQSLPDLDSSLSVIGNDVQRPSIYRIPTLTTGNSPTNDILHSLIWLELNKSTERERYDSYTSRLLRNLDESDPLIQAGFALQFRRLEYILGNSFSSDSNLLKALASLRKAMPFSYMRKMLGFLD